MAYTVNSDNDVPSPFDGDGLHATWQGHGMYHWGMKPAYWLKKGSENARNQLSAASCFKSQRANRILLHGKSQLLSHLLPAEFWLLGKRHSMRNH